MLFKISNSFFYTQKVVYFVFKDSSSPVKAPTYLRCIADQTRSTYDQPTLYRRAPRCTPAQHATCGECDHPQLFFNRLKNLSRSPRPLRAGPTNPRCILDQHTLSPIKARSLPIRPFFHSGKERGLIGSLTPLSVSQVLNSHSHVMYILSILLAKYTEIKVSLKSRKTMAWTKLTTTKVWRLIQCN